MLKKLLTLSTLLFAACGDDNPGTQDAGPGSDSSTQDDAMVDAPPTWTKPTPFKIPVSATAPDVAMSAAAGPSGTFYVAGWVADSVGGPRFAYVARLTSAGALDTTFNASGAIPGIYKSVVEFSGSSSGSDEIDIAVQSTGHIIMSFTIANDINALDRDIGVIRLSSAGALDTDYGDAGLARVNIGTAILNNTATLVGMDQARGLAIGPDDAVYLHAVSRDGVANAGMRTDTDFAVAKLDSDGALDTANYGGGDGFYLLDFGTPSANATPRALAVLSDGSVIAGGYANSSITNSVQPVLYKLTPTGTSDASFAGGLFHDTVLDIQTEIYSFAIDGDRITTAGYGRDVNEGSSSNCCNDWVSMRFDVDDGTRSTTFGGAAEGAVLVDVDPTAALTGHNCRAAAALNGGKTVLIGSAGNGGARNAAFAVLTQGGQLDTSYGTGYATWDLDSGTEDQWWSGVANSGKLLLAGWRGLGSTQTDTANDDSYGVLIDIE